MLEVDGLRAGYGNMEVLHGISVSVAIGESVAILGANGAGKSTLFKALFGHVRVAAGTLTFGGIDLRSSSADEVARAGLIHVPEGRGIFPGLTVEENLLVPIFASSRAGGFKSRREMVFSLFPKLKQRTTQLAGTMSGGEQQMLAIGRGLMADPKLLILDEPSIGLAPALVDEVFEKLAMIQQTFPDMAMLLVEQSATDAFALCSRGYLLDRGSIVEAGSTEDLSSSSSLETTLMGRPPTEI